MPASLTGLENFAGSGPNITVNNAMPNTPFMGAVSSAGVGTGSLGEFGGYIPTPLPQFNNYTDYLSAMPGATYMDKYANIPLQPGFYDYHMSPGGLVQNMITSPYGEAALTAAGNATGMALGSYFDESTGQSVYNPQGGFINRDWMPAAQQMYKTGNYLQQQLMPELTSQIPQMISAGQDIWNLARDPQSALYGRTAQQLTDQTRAGLAARGLSMDPYGAGIEGQTLGNFNIDWQNNLLARAAQGAQAYQGFEDTAARLGQAGASIGQAGAGIDTMAAGLQEQAAQDIAAFGRLQYDTNKDVTQNMWDALDRYGLYGRSAAAPYQEVYKNWQDIQNQFLTANQQGFNQNQISGFEDPFALLQLQSQIEMQREQMNMQEEMQKRALNQQMAMQGAQAGLSLLGGMGGK